MTTPTGQQYELSHGPYRAVVTELGATLRELTHDGQPLIVSFAEDASPVGCQGQQLLPWPNRIRDGRWTWEGVEQQLALTEPDRHNALHGLASWVPWTTTNQTDTTLTQVVTIYPQPGWPGIVEAELTHTLGDDGLTVTVRARNAGEHPVPFGYAAHPYLTAGGTIADSVVVVPAEQYLVVEPERLLPVRLEPVAGRPEDLRSPAAQGTRSLDTAYTALTSSGGWEASVSNGDRTVVVWGDENFGWIQVFNQTDGIAVEPMTCGPDAFNEGPTHADLITLAPGAEFSASWGLRAGSAAGGQAATGTIS